MRARNIKPGFFANEELAECSVAARLLFIGLWCMADREGRLEDRPKRIAKELFGYEQIDVPALLAELESKQFISRYCGQSTSDQGTKEVNCIQVNNFGKHQSPHRNEAESVLSSMDESTSDQGQKPLCPSPVPRRLNEDSLIADSLIEECGTLNPERPAPAEVVPVAPDALAVPAPGIVNHALPEAIDTPEMQVAWTAWVRHRKEKRSALTKSTAAAQAKKMTMMGVERAIAAINFSIEMGYIGLIEPGGTGPPKPPPSQSSAKYDPSKVIDHGFGPTKPAPSPKPPPPKAG